MENNVPEHYLKSTLERFASCVEWFTALLSLRIELVLTTVLTMLGRVMRTPFPVE